MRQTEFYAKQDLTEMSILFCGAVLSTRSVFLSRPFTAPIKPLTNSRVDFVFVWMGMSSTG